LTDGTKTLHITSIDDYRSSMRPGQDINIVSPLSRDGADRYARLMIFKDVDEVHHHEPHLKPKKMKGDYGCAAGPHMQSIPGIDEEEEYVELKKRHSISQYNAPRLKKRQELPKSCFGATRKILQIGVAADCMYTQNFGGSEVTLRRIISNFNQASQVCKCLISTNL
jgi:hypothetical protein